MYELVRVNFPFANDLEKGKKRPGVVISPAFGKHNQVIIAYITTQLGEVLPTDIVLDPNKKFLQSTDLVKKSVIKLHRIATFQPEAIEIGRGFLPEKIVIELKKKLLKVFKLK